jgi:hypothetical protein
VIRRLAVASLGFAGAVQAQSAEPGYRVGVVPGQPTGIAIAPWSCNFNPLSLAMVYQVVTTLDGAEVLRRAKRFFAERIPMQAAFPEKEGPTYLTLRGQGGEEIAIAVMPAADGTRVRASTLLFDQQVDRFLSTLPVPSESAA